jgi:hypothetical protein
MSSAYSAYLQALMNQYAVLAEIQKARAGVFAEDDTKPTAQAANTTAPTPAPVTDSPTTLNPEQYGLEALGLVGYLQYLLSEYNTNPSTSLFMQIGVVISQLQQIISNAQSDPSCIDPTMLKLITAVNAAVASSSPGALAMMIENDFEDLNQVDPSVPAGTTISDWMSENASSFVMSIPSSPSAQQLSDLATFAFAVSMLFVDQDKFHQTNFWGWINNQNPIPQSMAQLVPDLIAYYLWNQEGQPSPGDPSWASFQNDMADMLNALNPSGWGPPDPNYATFYANLQAELSQWSNGPPCSFQTVMEHMIEGLNSYFNNLNNAG